MSKPRPDLRAHALRLRLALEQTPYRSSVTELERYVADWYGVPVDIEHRGESLSVSYDPRRRMLVASVGNRIVATEDGASHVRESQQADTGREWKNRTFRCDDEGWNMALEMAARDHDGNVSAFLRAAIRKAATP